MFPVILNTTYGFDQRVEDYEMEGEIIELIHALQVQQIDLNQRLMNEWSKMGDLISEMLETNHKIVTILKEAVEKKG